jgi:hypothetical protein
MKAIEFIADAQDGTIKVPKKYWKDLEKKLRVSYWLMSKYRSKQKKIGKRKLKAMSVKTKGLVFDRDEANER